MLIINNLTTFRPGTLEILIQRPKKQKKLQVTEGLSKKILRGQQSARTTWEERLAGWIALAHSESILLTYIPIFFKNTR